MQTVIGKLSSPTPMTCHFRTLLMSIQLHLGAKPEGTFYVSWLDGWLSSLCNGQLPVSTALRHSQKDSPLWALLSATVFQDAPQGHCGQPQRPSLGTQNLVISFFLLVSSVSSIPFFWLPPYSFFFLQV